MLGYQDCSESLFDSADEALADDNAEDRQQVDELREELEACQELLVECLSALTRRGVQDNATLCRKIEARLLPPAKHSSLPRKRGA